MKEEVIQLAKKLGFRFEYNSKKLWNISIIINTLKDYPNIIEEERSEFYYLWLCQLQKWLREKHKIEAGVGYNFYAQKGRITYQMLIIYNDYQAFEQTSRFYNYEEALEQAILEALKLIK